MTREQVAKIIFEANRRRKWDDVGSFIASDDYRTKHPDWHADLVAAREEFYQMADAILAAQQGGAWQPIETAPKDGSWVLVAAGSAAHEARWWKGFDMWLGPGRIQFDMAPTHWQLLPAPPET